MFNIRPIIAKYKFFNFIYILCCDFIAKEGMQRVSSLAFTVLVSFVPFFIAIASITTFLFSEKTYSIVEQFIFKNYLPSTGAEVAKYMGYFHKYAGQLSLISFVFLFITSVMTINSISHHFEKLWDIKKERAPFGMSLIINFILMALGPLILGITLLITSYITSSFKLNNNIVLNLLTFATSILAFIIIYKFIPVNRVKFKYAVIAGLIAGVLFEITKRCFVIYVKYFATEGILYGALATIPLLLLWIYISCLILLFCAHIIVMIIKMND